MSVRRELARFGVWGLFDQALLSGTSFITMFAPARVLDRGAFGAYVLAFTSLLVLNGAQGSLFTGPHNVLGTGKTGRRYVRYTSSTGASQLVFAVVFTLLALALGAVLHAEGHPSSTLIFALAPAIFAWQVQEFLRRVLYTEGRLAAAVLNDLVSYGGQIVGIGLLATFGHIGGPSVLFVVAATSALAALLGCFQLRRSLALTVDFGAVRENWDFGKWLAGANAGYWLSSSAVLFLAGAVLGPGAPAILKAAQIILGPLNVLYLFLATVLPIVFSRALARSEDALMSRLRFAFRVTGPVMATYCLAAAVFAKPILHALYGHKYESGVTIVRLVALYYFVDYFGQVIRDVLKARRLTRPVFVGNLAGGVVAVAVGPSLLVALGPSGGALAMVLAVAILNTVLFRAFFLSREGRVTAEAALLPSKEPAALP